MVQLTAVVFGIGICTKNSKQKKMFAFVWKLRALDLMKKRVPMFCVCHHVCIHIRYMYGAHRALCSFRELICKRSKRITDGILWIRSFAVYDFELHLNGNIRVKADFDNDDDEPFMKFFFHFSFFLPESPKSANIWSSHDINVNYIYYTFNANQLH